MILFTINIALLKYYDPSRSYPVKYLTDANIFFVMVAETTWLLQFGKEIPEIIFVGIGYPEDKKHLTIRNRDLTPTPYDQPEPAGNSEKFLDFIFSELKPYIRSKYSIDEDDCCLMGDSLGGLFALYVLFNKPTDFQRYIIGNPSIYWDDSIILDFEKQFAEKSDELDAKVFLAGGN